MYEMWKRQSVHEDARKMHSAEVHVRKFGKIGMATSGRPRFGKRVDRQCEVLIWCRKCSGYARQRVGPKLIDCCKLELVGTKEHAKMLKRSQILEDGRVPANESKN